MVEILKFVRPETAFDPESIQVLASALDEAWSRIEQSGSQFARPASVLAGYARSDRQAHNRNGAARRKRSTDARGRCSPIARRQLQGCWQTASLDDRGTAC